MTRYRGVIHRISCARRPTSGAIDQQLKIVASLRPNGVGRFSPVLPVSLTTFAFSVPTVRHGRPGYRRRIDPTDIPYLNLTTNDERVARATSPKSYATVEQYRAALLAMPTGNEVERRDQVITRIYRRRGCMSSRTSPLASETDSVAIHFGNVGRVRSLFNSGKQSPGHQVLARKPTDAEGRKLRDAVYVDCSDKLFVFLKRRDAEPTNNESERALRPSVVFRKVTNGFRSEWGAKTYAALCSIVETGRRLGRSALTAIRDALALPAAQAASARPAHTG
jgi:hypothetical protein